MEYRVVTIRQPFATLIALGIKTIETRSWQTRYRGTLLIHAAKKDDRNCLALVCSDWFWGALHDVFGGKKPETRDDLDVLPRGAIIARTELRDCVLMTETTMPDEPERSFGFYEPGRFAWHLENTVPVKPIPAKGKLGLWHWQGEVESLCSLQELVDDAKDGFAQWLRDHPDADYEDAEEAALDYAWNEQFGLPYHQDELDDLLIQYPRWNTSDDYDSDDVSSIIQFNAAQAIWYELIGMIPRHDTC